MSKQRKSATNGDVTVGTRERILAAAWTIVDASGAHAATMKAVAKAASVSRQAVYLYFSDRAELLSALQDYIDEKVGLLHWMRDAESLPDVEAVLRRVAETRIQRSKLAASVIRAVEADRFRDAAAAATWKRRHEANASWMERAVVRRLDQEGRLHKSWVPNDAACLLVSLFSFRTWDDLTQARGWTAQHYIDTLVAAGLSILSGPASPRPVPNVRLSKSRARRKGS